MQLEILLLMVNAAATWFMTGLIWFVQIVHYPLFDGVSSESFLTYVERHRQLTSLVVAGPMIVEITTAMLLALTWKHSDSALLWIGFALVVGIWICTACCSIPCHGKLCSLGFSEPTHQWLVNSNWIRTFLWTARAGLLGYVIYKLLINSRVAKI